MTDVLAEIVHHQPQGRASVVDGAGHFVISTYPDTSDAMIDAHTSRIAPS